jgi:cold shock CspA family protein
MREIGIIKWFNIDKGYGFISRIDEIEDLFVHISQLTFREISDFEGVFVTYKLIEKKKRQASEVKLLKDEDDFEVAKDAFYSNRNGIWQHGFKKYVPTIKVVDDHIINMIIIKLETFRNSSGLLSFIPNHLFLHSSKLRNYLTTSKKIELLVIMIANSSNEEDKYSHLSELEKTLIQTDLQNEKDWSVIPDNILKENTIMKLVPKRRLFKYFITKLEAECSDIKISNFIEFLKTHPEFAPDIPDSLLKKFNELFVLLPPKRQIEIVWDELDKKWNVLSINAKLIAVYKSIKEKDKSQWIINRLKNQEEKNLLVRAYLLILSANDHMEGYLEKGINPFLKAHEMIQDFIINEIINPRNQLSKVLPTCIHNVTEFCEGRKWFELSTESESYKNDGYGNQIAFCPRKAGPCVIDDFGARINSNTNMDWSSWTFAELLKECGLESNLPELQKNDVYVLKLSGWVNRLIEIREKMNCSVCNETMVPDYKYAKNLAVYNSTVARCKHNHESVYLTHCWACHKIIDSRESLHKFDGFHICFHCGSGPKENRGSSSFRQGDICPKCYSPNMEYIGKKIRNAIHVTIESIYH